MTLRESVQELLFGKERLRFTQDSPVLPDVWLHYAEQPAEPVEVLLTPHKASSSGQLALQLRERLARERLAGDGRDYCEPKSIPKPGNAGSARAAQEESDKEAPLEWGERGRPRIAYTQVSVSTSLHFDELVRIVLPMTGWWTKYIQAGYLDQVLGKEGQRGLSKNLENYENGQPTTLRRELLWMIRVVAGLNLLRRVAEQGSSQDEPELEKAVRLSPADIADEIKEIVTGFKKHETESARVWLVGLNRPAKTAVYHSVLTVKGDAAQRVFDITCRGLCWAILDTGIDAKHLAFLGRNTRGPWRQRSRVIETYDFTRVSQLLDATGLGAGDLPDALQKIRRKGGKAADELERQLEALRENLLSGHEINWNLLRPGLRVHHDQTYARPKHSHGTHVAGILAARDPKAEEKRRRQRSGSEVTEEGLEPSNAIQGICPDIRLYDLRILDERGEGKEFWILAALQFVRHLNAERDHQVIHGVNLSLSIHHNVDNYACGATPICDECERLVASGVVTVAAAGNEGYRKTSTTKGIVGGYEDISITDPGNADSVLTVGSAHRIRPHLFGISYFSSRGPTGDGRIKPDLVAPGEKIVAPVPAADSQKVMHVDRKDGTSQAAPHVSGAAALLMARHKELIGDPQRVKEILCDTATDLGRERYFQGAGMVDVLRAIQSV